MLLVVGVLLTRGVDARYLMAAGLLTMALGNFWMSQLNLDIGPWQVVWPRVVIIIGTVDDLRPAERGGVSAYLPEQIARRGRGIARAAAQRRRQRRNLGRADHPGTARAVPHAAAQRKPRSAQPGRQSICSRRGRRFSCSTPAIPPCRIRWRCESSSSRSRQQASSLAYFDVFSVSAAVAVLMVFFVLLMRRSVAEKGAHIGAE